MDALNNNKVIKELIIGFLSGNISKEEMLQLTELLKNNPENRKLFNEIKEIWLASSYYVPASSPEVKVNEAWEKLQDSIDSDNNHKIIAPRKRSHSLSNVFRLAAGWLVLVALGSLSTIFFMSRDNQKEPSSTCIVSTPFGSKSQLTLPDGTKVWLNAGTVIRYPGKFSSNQRDIYLSGEAFFNVKTDKSKPFIVHTAKLNIRALGTAFNVKAYPSENKVSTTLVEGVVKLENIDASKDKFTYTLKPNQKLVYYISEPKTEEKIVHEEAKIKEKVLLHESTPVVVSENINTALSTSWKDKRWIIDGETLSDLAILLERRYDLKVNILSDELKTYKFSGIIENETIEQVMNYLSMTTPLKYEMQKGQVTISINQSMRDKYKSFLKSNN